MTKLQSIIASTMPKMLMPLNIQMFAGDKFDAKSFNPQAFGAYVNRIPNLKRNELLKSRALQPNTEIRNLFSSQTTTAYGHIPLFGNLDGTPLNYDGVTDITATSTVTYEQGVVVVGRAKAWVERDFSEDITGGVKFMDNVAQQVAQYWEEVDQDTLLSILSGIFAMTGTKNLEFVNKHTFDITDKEGNDGQGNPLNAVGPATLNTAMQQACGQNKGKFAIVIMHSAVATNLENLKLFKYMQYTDADGITRDLTIGTWNGRVVLIDDSMPIEEVDAAGEVPAYTKYTTYALGEGAFSYEDIGAKVPYEMARDASKNGGQDTLYSRQRKVFAPTGISYEKSSQATLSPTNAELANGANWTLVNDGNSVGANRKYIDHKAIPIARIISRG
ncbi:phage coat protein [Lysinibacillus sp. FSL P4-0201]|uniref:phage coat protein n=1 Tax=Lysinibacillus sp. FSL P4-0201 TaxID=2921721 RepID=UPI003159A3B0